MIIPIDENTRIVGTKLAWELQRQRNYKGGKKWEAYKWFVSFRHALEEAAQCEIRTDSATSITEAIAACSRVTEKYSRIFDDVGKPPSGEEDHSKGAA